MHKLADYWLGTVALPLHDTRGKSQNGQAGKWILVAFLSALATILQSAGGFLPGVGFAISPLATAPIALATTLSLRLGLIGYLLCCCLLLVWQPGELVIFPFSTGLLGLGLGIGLRLWKRRLPTMLLSSLFLLIGISVVFYVLDYPLMGPNSPTRFQWSAAGSTLAFSLLYGWVWTELCVRLLRRFGKAVVDVQ